MMRSMRSIARAVAALCLGMTLFAADCGQAAAGPGQSGAHGLLDVPYVSGTPESSGGAAVAMVLRYWGDRGVVPQDVAPLARAGDVGILINSLASAVRDRGWQALVVPAGDDAVHTRIRPEIALGRPLLALIEVGPLSSRYVVIVGSTDQEVVLHDPAHAPLQVLRWADFDRAWAATGRWMVLVLPPGGPRPEDDATRSTPAPSDIAAPVTDQTPCRALVRRGVEMALAGDGEEAELGLVAATRLCPNAAASWRELAGRRFSESRWTDARDLALSAVRLEPQDADAWQLLAASRFQLGDVMGALDAWNRTGEPRIDTTDIHGADRTRQPVVVRAAGLQPGEVLTSEAFARALRRLRDLPVASSARVTYEPIGDGLAKLDVFIDERKVAPTGWRTIAIMGARALLVHDVRVDVAGLLGEGELASVAWRWSSGRPRVSLGLALPSPRGLPGIVSIDGSWEQQSYDATPASVAATLVREERRRVGLQLGDWSTGWLRWQTGAALDHLREYGGPDQTGLDTRDYLSVDGTLNARLAADRLALAASASWWTPLAGGNRFGAGGLMAAWRTTGDARVPSWSAVTEMSVASGAAPLALWQGAGTGQGRSGLLRAHPLLSDGVLTGPVFGRDVAHASLEYTRPVKFTRAGRLSVAGFVDAAQAWHRLSGLGTSPLYVDAGVGVRVNGPGPGGAIRIDIAHGLRGGGTTLSASWGGSGRR